MVGVFIMNYCGERSFAQKEFRSAEPLSMFYQAREVRRDELRREVVLVLPAFFAVALFLAGARLLAAEVERRVFGAFLALLVVLRLVVRPLEAEVARRFKGLPFFVADVLRATLFFLVDNSFWVRPFPEPLLRPPPDNLLTVAQARFAASLAGTRFCLYPFAISLTCRFCFWVYLDLDPLILFLL